MGYNFLMKLVVNGVIIVVLLSTFYLILASRSFINESNHLLAVAWCKKQKDGVAYDEQISRFGIYVLMEKKSNEYSIRIRAMGYPIKNLFQPYRYAYSEVIAREPDATSVRQKWSRITCMSDNRASVGESGYVYKWSDN